MAVYSTPHFYRTQSPERELKLLVGKLTVTGSTGLPTGVTGESFYSASQDLDGTTKVYTLYCGANSSNPHKYESLEFFSAKAHVSGAQALAYDTAGNGAGQVPQIQYWSDTIDTDGQIKFAMLFTTGSATSGVVTQVVGEYQFTDDDKGRPLVIDIFATVKTCQD